MPRTRPRNKNLKALNRQIEYWDSVAGKKKFTHPLNPACFQKLIPAEASILDIGCGYGRICGELFNSGYRNIVGIDVSKEMIREGRHLFPQLDLRCVSPGDMPFQDHSFDAAVLFAVLTCIPTDTGQRDLIKSILRVLKPNGYIHVSDYFLQNDPRNRIRYEADRRKFGSYGTFELENGVVLRHHARSWIQKLLSPLNQISIREMEASTMNGHPSMIFQYWGRKQAYPPGDQGV